MGLYKSNSCHQTLRQAPLCHLAGLPLPEFLRETSPSWPNPDDVPLRGSLSFLCLNLSEFSVSTLQRSLSLKRSPLFMKPASQLLSPHQAFSNRGSISTYTPAPDPWGRLSSLACFSVTISALTSGGLAEVPRNCRPSRNRTPAWNLVCVFRT